MPEANGAASNPDPFGQIPPTPVIVAPDIQSVNHHSPLAGQSPSAAADEEVVATRRSQSAGDGSCKTPSGQCTEEGGTLTELRSVPRRKDSFRRRHRSLDLLNCDDEDLRRRSTSMVEAKEQTYSKLKEELLKAQHELKLKDEEVGKLAHVRDQMGEELEELTASLFEEANKMVQDANVKRMKTEKLLGEANDKIAILQAEVLALKTLVLTSTPSAPNSHLHPQIKKKEGEIKKASSVKGHKRSASHHFLKKDKEPLVVAEPPPAEEPKRVADAQFYEEFSRWRLQPEINEEESPFIARVFKEDIRPCLNLPNTRLSGEVLKSVGDNTLTIEPVAAPNKLSMRKCALSQRTTQCSYRIKLCDSASWLDISETVRNRVISVCDFYTYIGYIQKGLVKSSEMDMYWHIIHLRQQMALARLGLS